MSAPQLFTNGEFELPVLPDGDSFRVNGMVVARQLGFRYAADMVRTLADDEKVFIEKPSSPQHATEPTWTPPTIDLTVVERFTPVT